MGCTGDSKYEPPKEFEINDYLKKKEKIINEHIANSTQPNSSEIILISKYDIDIYEFLARNIKQSENQLKKAKSERAKKHSQKKFDYFSGLKDKFEILNYQWDELLGYREQEKKYIEENKEFVKENIEKNNLREGVVYVEEEEEEDELDSKDYYCNTKFYEKNPKIVGENNDVFKSYVESVKDDDDENDIVIPYGM